MHRWSVATAKPEFDQLLINASWILAGSFLLSAVLNYFLAVYLLTADPGTQAFNEQLGKMTALELSGDRSSRHAGDDWRYVLSVQRYYADYWAVLRRNN